MGGSLRQHPSTLRVNRSCLHVGVGQRVDVGSRILVADPCGDLEVKGLSPLPSLLANANANANAKCLRRGCSTTSVPDRGGLRLAWPLGHLVGHSVGHLATWL